MKVIKKCSKLFCLALSCNLLLSSCEDERTGTIVHTDTIEGKWIYDGITMDVQTSFLIATDTIKKDIQKKNKTSEFIIQLYKDKRYIISDHTVLQDSGRYELSLEKLIFESKMHSKPYLESAPLYLNDNDLTLTYDVTSVYNADCLDSLGIKSAESVTVHKAIYYYLFKR